MVRRIPLVAGVAAGLLLGTAGPALASQPYHINFNNVSFSSGALSGLDNTNGTLTLSSGQLPTFAYTDPYASVPVLGAHVDGSGNYSYGTWTSPVYNLTFPF